jgi:hypothetical protein
MKTDHHQTSNTKEVTMVAGAVVYSLVLIGVRELARLASLGMHDPHRVGHGSLQGGAHCGARVYGLERTEGQRSHSE